MTENKNQRFKRVASSRVQKLLHYLRLLKNCSNKAIYEYTEEETKKIFSTLERELKQTKLSFKEPQKKFKL